MDKEISRPEPNGDSAYAQEAELCSKAAIRVVINKENRHIGFAFLSVEAFTLHLCEFHDDSSYTCLESVLLQSRPQCCSLYLVGSHETEQKKLCRVIERCNVQLDRHPLADADVVSAGKVQSFDVLLRLEEKSQQHYKGIQKLLSAQKAAQCLLMETRLLDDPSQVGQYALRVFAPSSYMRLDQATFSALHIFPEREQQRPTPGNSLFGLLNKCRTPMGTQRLKTWIVQPSLDLNEIQHRQDIVALFLRHPDLRQVLSHDHLQRLPNLDALLYKLHRVLLKHDLAPSSLCSLQDVLHLHQGVAELHGVLAVLHLLEERDAGAASRLHHRFTQPLQAALTRLQRFQDLVDYTLDPQEQKAGRALIHRQFDPQLQVLAERKDHFFAKIEEHRRDIEKSLPLGRSAKKNGDNHHLVKVLECNAYGFVFRVTKKDQPIVQRDKARFKQVRINKAEFQFTTKELMSLSDDYRDALAALETQQRELALKTVLAAASYWPVIETLAELIGHFDILLSFADVAATAPTRYCRPTVWAMDDPDHQTIELREARHPLLEVQYHIRHVEKTHAQSSVPSVVPNTTRLTKPDSFVHLITGPNMGGKSTYIRQVGLICLMAQLGCYVPCEAASITIVDAILCRVGASDDQLRGISTFYAEMIETAAILKSSTSHSLILMDELGRGTSTSEGLALAFEVTRYMAQNIRCYCLFATHFQELHQLETSTQGIQCYQVDVHAAQTQLQFHFRVLPGCADHSYGVHVAEMAGMNPSVIQRARHLSATLQRCEQRCHQDPSLMRRLYSTLQRLLEEPSSPSSEQPPNADSQPFLASMETLLTELTHSA